MSDRDMWCDVVIAIVVVWLCWWGLSQHFDKLDRIEQAVTTRPAEVEK